jgi:hypothetical protein
MSKDAIVCRPKWPLFRPYLILTAVLGMAALYVALGRVWGGHAFWLDYVALFLFLAVFLFLLRKLRRGLMTFRLHEGLLSTYWHLRFRTMSVSMQDAAGMAVEPMPEGRERLHLIFPQGTLRIDSSTHTCYEEMKEALRQRLEIEHKPTGKDWLSSKRPRRWKGQARRR